ncbi:ATP-dependent DNA ligase, partial [Klebsiella pneumoniae]
NHGMTADSRAKTKAPAPKGKLKAPLKQPPQAKSKQVADMPDFVAPQLCAAVESPPNAAGWCHEIKFDGYRVQLRIADGEAVLKTRKGLDWSDKFGAIVKEAGKLPDALIDGEIVALDAKGIPHFSALQAALSDGKTDQLI